jgi:hypothetical protein
MGAYLSLFMVLKERLTLTVTIIEQMRLIENSSCKKGAAMAIKALSRHYPEDIVEHLLHQPLPLDNCTKGCWKELGKADDAYLHVCEFFKI